MNATAESSIEMKKLLKTAALSSLLAVVALAGWILWHDKGTAPAGLALDCGPVNTTGPMPGMAWVPGGRFTMGMDATYREESPAHASSVTGFWMDQTEVTNAQFADFVAATGYVTLAERGISNPLDPAAPPLQGSAVFVAPGSESGFDPFMSWWRFIEGANWRQPQGPGSSIAGLEQQPVVHVAFEDAEAYAHWKGHRLPTEAQFEFAAKNTSRQAADGTHLANTWQGFFPLQHEAVDGHEGTAPVACYSANEFGLYDLIGNVWEWTASPYYEGHDAADKALYPEGFDPLQPEEEAVAVIKGGSYLCAPNYCMRYRPEARQAQSKGLGTSHIGFRTVRDPDDAQAN
jgi:formylglycine-generating enzyme